MYGWRGGRRIHQTVDFQLLFFRIRTQPEEVLLILDQKSTLSRQVRQIIFPCVHRLEVYEYVSLHSFLLPQDIRSQQDIYIRLKIKQYEKTLELISIIQNINALLCLLVYVPAGKMWVTLCCCFGVAHFFLLFIIPLLATVDLSLFMALLFHSIPYFRFSSITAYTTIYTLYITSSSHYFYAHQFSMRILIFIRHNLDFWWCWLRFCTIDLVTKGSSREFLC